MTAREYRYVSPVLMTPQGGGTVKRIKGAGLVHTPNLYIAELSAEQAAGETDGMDPMDRLRAALDLDPDADRAAILAAVVRLMRKAAGVSDEGNDGEEMTHAAQAAIYDPRDHVPREAVQAMLADTNGRLSAAADAHRQGKVESAMRAGHITPALREWATDLCARDEASFDAFLAKTPPVYAHLATQMVPSGPPPGRADGARPDADVANVCAQLGLSPDRLA